MDSFSEEQFGRQIITYIKTLEKRISILESHAGIESKIEDEDFKLPAIFTHKTNEETDALEEEIGQFWFAKAGIAVLVLGLIFILTLPFNGVPSFVPSVIGFGVVILLTFVSRYLKDSFELLSNYLFGAGMFLSYFAALRLHYFAPDPAIVNTTLTNLVLFFVSSLLIYISYKRNSVYLMAFSIPLALVSSLLCGNILVFHLTLLILSLFILFLKLKYDYSILFYFSVILIFLSIAWFGAGNHLFSQEKEIVKYSLFNPFLLLVYCIIFAFSTYKTKENKESPSAITGAALSTIFPLLLLLILTGIGFQHYLTILHLTAAIIFLVIAVMHYTKFKSRYITFLYAITSYTALSIAIIGFFPKPEFFVWLSWQSFLVVSTAIWFRSKIIIVANFIIYLIIYMAYLILAEKFGVISLSFGFVALFSARILNWQKHRLELKTEIMRNAYLVAAFFIFPFALYHIVPDNYVSIAWMAVALFYLILGLIFKNKKYRWMALSTFLLTVIYLLTFGSSGSDTALRIISFIILGVVLMATSMYYAKRKKSKA